MINQFVLLVHPCPYEAAGRGETDPYRALERAVSQRWFDAISSLPKSTFAVQIDYAAESIGPGRLHEAFIARLGMEHICRIPCEIHAPENPAPLKKYYGKIHRKIVQQMDDQGLTFDPATCKTLIWGQSFEGCASGFGSAIAYGLGMKTFTQFDYDMSVPDANFLLKAKLLQTVAVPASDVEAYIFDLNDGRYATFFRSALTPQWLDHRPIVLQLDSEIFSVLSKNQGIVVWPDGALPTGTHSFTLSTVQERFVVGTHLEKLISIIKSTEVK